MYSKTWERKLCYLFHILNNILCNHIFSIHFPRLFFLCNRFSLNCILRVSYKSVLPLLISLYFYSNRKIYSKFFRSVAQFEYILCNRLNSNFLCNRLNSNRDWNKNERNLPKEWNLPPIKKCIFQIRGF